MATYSTTIAPTMASDAEFRILVAAIRDAIDQVATRTADTGQIDTATVIRPAGGNSAAGYNMWSLTDGLSNVFFKLEYGRGSSITLPMFWITFGTVSDGAGALSGAATTRQSLTVTASTTLYGCLFSGDANRFSMVLFHDHATISSRLAIGLERDHLVDGTDDDDYYFAVYGSSNTSTNDFHNRCVKMSGDQWRAHGQLGLATPDGTDGVLGLDVAGWPVRPLYGTERNPSRNWHVVMAANVASGTVFDTDIFGTSQQWVRTGATPNRSSAYALCMRYE